MYSKEPVLLTLFQLQMRMQALTMEKDLIDSKLKMMTQATALGSSDSDDSTRKSAFADAEKTLAAERMVAEKTLAAERKMRSMDNNTWERALEVEKRALDVEKRALQDEKARRTKAERALNCVTCKERSRTVFVQPCRHLALCGVCGEGATACPLCGMQLKGKCDVLLE